MAAEYVSADIARNVERGAGTLENDGKFGLMHIKELVGSGHKIVMFVAPLLLVGAVLNIMFPAWFSVGMPSCELGGISVLMLIPGFIAWFWSARLLLRNIPKRQLITTGPFAVVKHPLYTGVALLVFPWFGLLCNTWLGIPIGIMFYIGCRMYAPEEERALAERFGPAWDAYTKKVKIPWL